MKNLRSLTMIFFALCLTLNMVGNPQTFAYAKAETEAKLTSPEEFINPDGTLKLDGSFSGAFDLAGWSVQMDSAHGPVFSPLAAQDNWEAVGTGGGPFSDTVYAVAVNGTDVYVGGWFQNAGDVPEADYIAKWNGSQWVALSNGGSGMSALGSVVNAMQFIGSDLYVAGWFSTSNTSGALIANAAKFAKWNGSVWSAAPGMTANLSGNAQALAYDSFNNIIYVGGNFNNVNGATAADNIFGMDLDTNTLVVLGSNGSDEGSLNNSVYALAVDSSGIVYAGGFFTDVNDSGSILPEADYIAAWNGSAWIALGDNGAGMGALNYPVFSIAIDAANNVYAGGSFDNAAGIATADYIAKWDISASSWSALGSDGSGGGALLATGEGSTVIDILINGTDVYVSGYFIDSAGIPTADYLARFDTVGGTWSGLGNNGSGDGSLNYGALQMALSAGNLYVVGNFYDVNNGGLTLPSADRFAFWDGTNWQTLGDSDGMFNQNVEAMAVIGTDVYVGGQFYDLGGDSRIDYIARWDGSAWNPLGNLTQNYGSLNSHVMALAVDGTDLYVGGFFSLAYNEGAVIPEAGHVAKWDGAVWSGLGNGLGNNVYALAVDASHTVYAGGSFTNADSIPEADYIAKWNGSAWSALSGNGSAKGALNSAVLALAVSGANVYVGGDFTLVKNTSNIAIPNAGHLAKWNGSAWSAMDGITSPVGDDVFALVISGSDVYVGGIFSDLNGIVTADNIAKWNGSAWSGLGNNGAGDGSLTNYVKDIAVDGNRVFVGGFFTNVTNVDTTILGSADYVAVWDGSNWSALGSDGSSNGSLKNLVTSLLVVDNDLWVGGNFQDVNNNGSVVKEADRLAVYGLEDNIAPTVVSITRDNPSPTNLASVGFTVTFSESVMGVDENDFSLTISGVPSPGVSGISGSGSSYTVTVSTGTGNGTIGLDVISSGTGITDAVGNALSGGFTSGEIYTVDKTAPTVTMTSAASDPTNTSPIPVTVQFSETVTGFTSNDIVPANGAVNNFTAVDGDTYTFDLTPSAQGLVTADIAAGVASDSAGNGSTAATQFSRTYTVTIVYNLFLPLVLR